MNLLSHMFVWKSKRSLVVFEMDIIYNLEAKKFFVRFCAGTLDHISLYFNINFDKLVTKTVGILDLHNMFILSDYVIFCLLNF